MNGDGSVYADLEKLLRDNKRTIEAEAGIVISSIALNLCNDLDCSGNGVCISRVIVNDQLDFTATNDLILTYNTAELVPMCQCQPEYMGRTCQEPAGACRSSPCQNGGTCVRLSEEEFECQCTESWTGVTCQTDVLECQLGTHKCQNSAT